MLIMLLRILMKRQIYIRKYYPIIYYALMAKWCAWAGVRKGILE